MVSNEINQQVIEIVQKEIANKIYPRPQVELSKTFESFMCNKSPKIFISIEELCSNNSIKRKALNKISKEKGFKLKIKSSTFGILHELGHIISLCYYNNVDQLLFERYQEIRKIFALGIEDFYELNKLYREIRIEKDADNFAYEFYKKWENEIIETERKIFELLNGV